MYDLLEFSNSTITTETFPSVWSNFVSIFVQFVEYRSPPTYALKDSFDKLELYDSSRLLRSDKDSGI